MSDDNYARFQKVVAEALDVDGEKITMEASFSEDLEADSLDLVEMVMDLEEEFSVEVEEEELEGIDVVKNAFELITSKL